MTERRTDYLLAFAIGAALGAGVAWLLGDRRESRVKRIRKRGRRMRKMLRNRR